jgi:hypothetical protein
MATATGTTEKLDDDFTTLLGVNAQEAQRMDREMEQMLVEMKRLHEESRMSTQEIERDAAEAWVAIRQTKAILGL